MDYFVTTQLDRLPLDRSFIMVDGTVPLWKPCSWDRHWDHHRLGGAAIQVEEMPLPIAESIVGEHRIAHPTAPPLCLVTTMVDADACVAAAWVQLSRSCLMDPDIRNRLRAIAWDCDHLTVPPELADYGEFAAKGVAALKETAKQLVHSLGLDADRKQWSDRQYEQYYSSAFRQGTEWLVAAARQERSWPGEQGEADSYWQLLQGDGAQILAEQRIQLFTTPTGSIAFFDLQGIDRYVDPKACYQALQTIVPALDSLRPETIVLRDHRQTGRLYTIGSLPLHPQQKGLDFLRDRLFERLSHAEKAIDPSSGTWGGRRTVGGSPWNNPSRLSPEQVVEILEKPLTPLEF